MNTITICPACSTAFRVDRAQLEARNGQVRCGVCRTVFDARSSLHIVGDDAKIATAAPGRSPAAPPVPAREASQAETKAPAPTKAGPVATAKPSARRKVPPTPSAAGQFSLPDFKAERRRSKKQEWLWAVVSLPLVFLGAMQAAYYYRSELVVMQPELRPAFEFVCVRLGCDITLPRHVELMSIEGSDLQAEGGGVLTLAATLRNRAAFEQALPAVELTLTDLRDQPLLRRVLQPHDYLGPLTPSAPGIPAGGEIQLRVPFDVSEAHPAGYRLYVFYP